MPTEDPPKEDPVLPFVPGRLRKRLTYGALGCIVVLWVATEIRQRRLEGDVAELAEQQIQKLTEPGLEYAAAFSATRDLLLIGTPRARVEIFMRDPKKEASILGVAYFFAQQDGEWQLEESAGCTAEDCVSRGRTAFARKH